MLEHITDIDDRLLRAWQLPQPQDDDDKEARGRLLVIGGSPELVGAVLLAGTAALRAGVGKLTIATCDSVARPLAVTMPEARVIGLPQTAANGIAAEGVQMLAPILKQFAAILIGPGMQDEAASVALADAVLAHAPDASIVIDAGALDIVSRKQLAPNMLLTPHAGEMAHLCGQSKQEICAFPMQEALAAARRWNALVALKGATTWVASPEGRCWRHEAGNAGLAVSGSGDTLSGIIAGLAARGATLEQAACWGVALHARAGDRLAQRIGPLGFLAREILGEIPALLHAFCD